MKTIQDMAREAQLPYFYQTGETANLKQLERFAALVRADERNRTWTPSEWTEYERSIAAAEREACAKVVDAIEAKCVAKDVDDPPLEHVAAAIRARGTTPPAEQPTYRAVKTFHEGKPVYVAQPEQEPVAWVCYGAPGKRDIDFEEADINKLPIGTQLYTTPPQRPWVGLTDEEIETMLNENFGYKDSHTFARAIEAKLRSKNT